MSYCKKSRKYFHLLTKLEINGIIRLIDDFIHNFSNKFSKQVSDIIFYKTTAFTII